MIRKDFLRLFSYSQRISLRFRSSQSIDIEKLEQESPGPVDIIDEEARIREEELEKKRNKSRLRPADYNFLHNKKPNSEITYAYQGTLKYMRRLYGRYGESSGVNPSICWPTKDALAESIEYEKVAFPYTIQQVIEAAAKRRSEKEKKLRQRQEDIAKKAAKLDEWKQDLQNKIMKKENEAKAAREKKERLMEEVRMHFGYTVDPRDEKFKEMVAKKEKEQKKAEKEARKKAREEMMLAKMLAKKTDKSAEKSTEDS